ncbi:MAG: aspartate kinase, partial [Burkholderiales bacterium]
MLVLKFGGTSVSSKPSIETICKIAKRELTQKPVIVVSALSNVTNLLVALAKQRDTVAQKEIITQISTIHLDLIKQIFIASDQVYLEVIDYIQSKLAELTQVVKEVPAEYTLPQWQDRIVAYGETMSSFLIAQFLTLNGVKALPVLATQFLVTNNNFGAANFIKRLTQQKAKQLILPLIKQQIVPVITGFIGATVDGQITTLGRGGSDYSASIIGYALKSKEIQIWTDVDGVYSTDPRVVKDAR